MRVRWALNASQQVGSIFTMMLLGELAAEHRGLLLRPNIHTTWCGVLAMEEEDGMRRWGLWLVSEAG